MSRAGLSTGACGDCCFQVLREHLRGYERDLKEELYNVINRDLADYLDLSSKVRLFILRTCWVLQGCMSLLLMVHGR